MGKGDTHRCRGWFELPRAGLSCYRCHKTWEWCGAELIGTWDLNGVEI
jgi:hypothetical protein